MFIGADAEFVMRELRLLRGDPAITDRFSSQFRDILLRPRLAHHTDIHVVASPGLASPHARWRALFKEILQCMSKAPPAERRVLEAFVERITPLLPDEIESDFPHPGRRRSRRVKKAHPVT